MKLPAIAEGFSKLRELHPRAFGPSGSKARKQTESALSAALLDACCNLFFGVAQLPSPTAPLLGQLSRLAWRPLHPLPLD